MRLSHAQLIPLPKFLWTIRFPGDYNTSFIKTRHSMLCTTRQHFKNPINHIFMINFQHFQNPLDPEEKPVIQCCALHDNIYA